MHVNEVTFRMHVNFWMLTAASDIQQLQRLLELGPLSRSRRARSLLTKPINDAAPTERNLSAGRRRPPATLFWPLVPPRTPSVTAAVTGGACDLCLTNGRFIIPSATSTGLVFMALYFRLNPQRRPSIMVTSDLYWRWRLGLEEEKGPRLQAGHRLCASAARMSNPRTITLRSHTVNIWKCLPFKHDCLLLQISWLDHLAKWISEIHSVGCRSWHPI